jgi:hypothetical protein
MATSAEASHQSAAVLRIIFPPTPRSEVFVVSEAEAAPTGGVGSCETISRGRDLMRVILVFCLTLVCISPMQAAAPTKSQKASPISLSIRTAGAWGCLHDPPH